MEDPHPTRRYPDKKVWVGGAFSSLISWPTPAKEQSALTNTVQTAMAPNRQNTKRMTDIVHRTRLGFGTLPLGKIFSPWLREMRGCKWDKCECSIWRQSWGPPTFPDPPSLAFLKKNKGNPEKKQEFSLCGTPKSLEKKGKTVKNRKKARNSNKKQELEGQGFAPCNFWGGDPLEELGKWALSPGENWASRVFPDTIRTLSNPHLSGFWCF